MMTTIVEIVGGGVGMMIGNPLTIAAGYIAAKKRDHPVVNVALVLLLGGLAAVLAIVFSAAIGGISNVRLLDTSTVATGLWTILFVLRRRWREARNRSQNGSVTDVTDAQLHASH